MNRQNEMNDAGIYAVHIYALGVPTTVMVDDRLPLINRGGGQWGTLYAAVGDDSALWGPILEKAFAKFYGNYAHIESGDPAIGVRTLSGSPYVDWKTAQHSADEIFAKMQEFDGVGNMIVAGTPGGSDKHRNRDGLVQGHAYSVLKPIQLSDGTKIIKIRNPHGKDSFKGDWSDKSWLWTPQFKAEAGFVDDPKDGVIHMSASDFKAQFSSVAFNLDTSSLYYDYYLKQNERTRNGVWSFCGPSCSHHKMQIVSDVDQTLYVTGYTWDKRMLPKRC